MAKPTPPQHDMSAPVPTGTPKGNALAAVQAACEVQERAWLTLGKAIALMRILGQDPTRALSLRASASQRITFYNRLFHDLQAAGSVVRPPSLDEIKETRSLLAKVSALSATEAATDAGLKILANALTQAAASTRGVRPG